MCKTLLEKQSGVQLAHNEQEEWQSRLRSCLQTVVEMEPLLAPLEEDNILRHEFSVLNNFLQEIESLSLDEEKVLRVENATKHLLQELQGPYFSGQIKTLLSSDRAQ